MKAKGFRAVTKKVANGLLLICYPLTLLDNLTDVCVPDFHV